MAAGGRGPRAASPAACPLRPFRAFTGASLGNEEAPTTPRFKAEARGLTKGGMLECWDTVHRPARHPRDSHIKPGVLAPYLFQQVGGTLLRE